MDERIDVEYFSRYTRLRPLWGPLPHKAGKQMDRQKRPYTIRYIGWGYPFSDESGNGDGDKNNRGDEGDKGNESDDEGDKSIKAFLIGLPHPTRHN